LISEQTSGLTGGEQTLSGISARQPVVSAQKMIFSSLKRSGNVRVITCLKQFAADG
jgi:hypothetical protein